MNALVTDADLLRVVTTPSAWRVICSLFAPDVAPCDAGCHGALLNRAAEHTHEFRQIAVALRGDGIFCLQRRAYPFSPGTILLADVSEPHWVECADSAYCVLRINLADHCFLVVVHTEKDPPWGSNLRLPEGVICETEAGILLDQCWSELLQEQELPSELRRARLISALGMLLTGVVAHGGDLSPRGRLLFQRDVVQTVQKHIAQSLDRHLDLDELAQLSGYSRYHFARIFREQTGQSVHEYVDLCRLEKLKELEARGESQKRIAAALGFARPSSLSIWKRRQRGRGYWA